jgi:hypothetical protein
MRDPATTLSTHRQRSIADGLTTLAPLMPFADAEHVRAHAARLTRQNLSLGAALWLALVARVRHAHTEYDALLADGYDRDSARFFTREPANAVLMRWGCRREIAESDDEAEDGAA